MDIAVEELSKPELKQALTYAISEVSKLRDTVTRLLRQNNAPVIVRHAYHSEDTVPAGWAEQHKIEIPRSDGIFESAEAWIRIKHGIIVGAGIKNQSILHLAISLDLLDQGAEHHGNLYKDWRAAFLSRLDPATGGGTGRDDPEAWSKEDRYSKLLRRIEQDYLQAMDCIVAIRPKAKHLAAFQGNQIVFISAFETVAKAMMEIEREAGEVLDHVSKQ